MDAAAADCPIWRTGFDCCEIWCNNLKITNFYENFARMDSRIHQSAQACFAKDSICLQCAYARVNEIAPEWFTVTRICRFRISAFHRSTERTTPHAAKIRRLPISC
ncbi:protein of unknown function [Burkholderia multivorans]